MTDKKKRKKINEILEAEEGIAMASEVLLNISRDEIERARLFSEEKYELTIQSRITWAKKKSKEEIARKALAKGASIEFVQEITGLSAEEIEKL